MPDLPEALGDCYLDSSIIDALSRLWEGPLSPEDLPRIEIGLRAFLTSPRMFGVQQTVVNEKARLGRNKLVVDYQNYVPPFHDGLLEYEFTYPDEAPTLATLEQEESNFLTESILNHLKADSDAALKEEHASLEDAVEFVCAKWLGREFFTQEEQAFLDDYIYSGGEFDHVRDGITRAEVKSRLTAFNQDDFKTSGLQYAAEQIAARQAQFYVRCHRTGLLVYSDTPTARICNDFLFSLWPRKLFEDFDAEYAQVTRELRGPGISLELPVLIAVLLSRATRRSNIPEALRDLRDEYADARRDLWSHLRVMWGATTLREQIKSLSALQNAAKFAFKAAFKERLNVLSIGLDLATGSVVGASKQLLEYDKPNARVKSISFASQFADDVQHTILNHRTLLKRHLRASELLEFGAA